MKVSRLINLVVKNTGVMFPGIGKGEKSKRKINKFVNAVVRHELANGFSLVQKSCLLCLLSSNNNNHVVAEILTKLEWCTPYLLKLFFIFKSDVESLTFFEKTSFKKRCNSCKSISSLIIQEVEKSEQRFLKTAQILFLDALRELCIGKDPTSSCLNITLSPLFKFTKICRSVTHCVGNRCSSQINDEVVENVKKHFLSEIADMKTVPYTKEELDLPLRKRLK